MTVFGQNLVPNGSFETMRSCPYDFNYQNLTQIDKWWQVGKGTPDYFNECSSTAGVPENVFGNVAAQDGKAYAGFVTYSNTRRNYREYLQTKLTRPLAKGEEICIEFYISTAAKSLFVCDGVGVYLSKNKITTRLFNTIHVKPQVENVPLNILNAYGTWVKISDTFIAKGGETYLTIGNFHNDNEMTKLKRNSQATALKSNPWSYLYVDHVTIKKGKTRDQCSCVNDIIAATIHDPPLELQEIEQLSIKSLLFDFDKYELTDSSTAILQETLKILHTNKNIFIEIIGHTDNIGNEYYNDSLSKKRADQVIQYFIDKGIDKNRLREKYYGSKKPVSNNNTADGRSKNRRVEFNISLNKYDLIH